MKKLILLLLIAAPVAAFRPVPHSAVAGLDTLQTPPIASQHTDLLTPSEVNALTSRPDLRLVYSQTVPGQNGLRARTYSSYVQTYQGADVVGTFMNVAYTAGAKSADVTSSLYTILPQVQVAPADWNASSSRMKGRAKSTRVDRLDRKVRWLAGHWRQVHEFNVTDRGLHGAVDSNGQTYLWDERYYVTHQGTARGRRVDFDPVATGTSLSTIPLPHLQVTDNIGNATYTDANGVYTLTTASPADLTINLNGQWARVVDQQNSPVTATISGSAPNPVDLLFNPSGATDSKTAQVNVFSHLNYEHDWIVAHGVHPSGLDISIPAYTNENATCNAYFDGLSVHFYAAGNGCINTAYDTVAYHEYGHFIDFAVGGITDGGLSEGWGDIMAMYITGQPIVGEGFNGISGVGLRTGLNNYQYHAGDEVHALGQAWMGFAWNLHDLLGATLAENLVIPVFLANSPDIPAAVREVARRDSPDGQLGNGPHFSQIMSAATNHRLAFVFDLVPPTAPSNVAFTQPGPFYATITWSPATDNIGVTGYFLDISTSPMFNSYLPGYANHLTASNNSESVQSLSPSTTYYFRMRAQDGAGNISPNSTITVGVTPPQPTQPAGIVAALRAGSSTSYLSLSGIAFSQDLFYSGGETASASTITITNTNDPALYAFERAAFGSNTVYYSIPVAPGAYRVRLLLNSWLASQKSNLSDIVIGTTTFVHRLDVAARVNTPNAFVAYDLNYGTVVTGPILHLELHALSGAPGISGIVVSTATVNKSPPTTPLFISASQVTGHGATVLWGPSQDDERVAGYRIDISTYSDFRILNSSYTDRDLGIAAQITPTELSPNTTYYVRVRSYDEWLNFSPYIGTSFLTHVDTTPPTAPQTLIVQGYDPNTLFAYWGASSDDSGSVGYQFDLSLSPNFTSYVLGYQNISVGATTSLYIASLQPSTTYYMRVRAYDPSGNLSGYSPTGVGVTVPPPSAPTVQILYPPNGATLKGLVTFSGTAISTTTPLSQIGISVDGINQGSIAGTTNWSYVLNADLFTTGTHLVEAYALTTSGFKGVADISIVTNQVNSAVYSSVNKTPACAGVSQPTCSTYGLLNGRGLEVGGIELNTPNTLNNSCSDGVGGTYHSDESLDELSLSTLDGSPIAPGIVARIDATVYAFSSGSLDSLDLYYTSSISSPTWTYIKTIVPTHGGLQVLSATFTVPSGQPNSYSQAIRGHFRFGGSVSPCSSAAYDDTDDLIFSTFVSTPAPTTKVVVRAWGDFDQGYPLMQLKMGDTPLASWTVNSTPTDYVYTTTAPLTAAKLRVVFDNDLYDPPADRNLWVQTLTLNGHVYNTTDLNVYGAGAWLNNACREGYLGVQALYCNGYFEFPTTAAGVAPSNIVVTDDLTAPSNLQATDIETDQVQLSWAAPSSRKVSFAVYRNRSLIAMSDTPSFLDTTVASGSAYDYSVAAYATSSGLSLRSATLNVKTPSSRIASSGNGANVSVNDLGGLLVFPNPWRADRPTSDIHFQGVPTDATIKIFTLSGRWIRTLAFTGNNARWDLKTDSGDPVASGIYVYLVTDPRSDKVRGQLAIIR